MQKRTALKASIQAGSTLLQVFSTHLLHTHQKPSQIQDEQADQLLKFAPTERTIIMGDFNALPESNAVRIVSQAFNNSDLSFTPTAFVDIDGCPVCRIDKAILRLDYIFVSRDITIETSRVDITQGPDHLPITTIIQV